MLHLLPRPPVWLFALAASVAAAIAWGGVSLAKRERLERIEGDRNALTGFGRQLQEKLDALESEYEERLEALGRSDLNDGFALRDAVDAVVGVRQFSTLNLSGKVDVHLLAGDVAEDEAGVPLPVFDPDDLPPGRKDAAQFDGREAFGGGVTHAQGWLETPGGSLFFFCNVSDTRTALLLIDRAAVGASIESWLADWMSEALSANAPREGGDAVMANGRLAASAGTVPDRDADVSMQLRFRFGDWQIRSWDPRRRIVEYDRGILAGTGLLAMFVLLAAGAGTLYLNRALRVAEQRVSFVNRVSHELKSPLTNILLNTDLAADGADAEGRRRLAMIGEETRRLARLIDNVLSFARQERNDPGLRIHRVELSSLVEAVTAQFRPSFERRCIDMTVRVPGTVAVLADADALAQILGNLLSNIEKYAASGGVARIEAAAGPDEILVRVADRGPGIPRGERERVFKPFRRLDHRPSEGASGTGLGLAIARDLAERMGGSLRLAARGGETGATFELRLPVAGAGEKVVEFPGSRAS